MITPSKVNRISHEFESNAGLDQSSLIHNNTHTHINTLFYDVYRVIPGHGNWQIETTVCNLSGYLLFRSLLLRIQVSFA